MLRALSSVRVLGSGALFLLSLSLVRVLSLDDIAVPKHPLVEQVREAWRRLMYPDQPPRVVYISRLTWCLEDIENQAQRG